MRVSKVDECGVGRGGQTVLHALVEDVPHVASPFVVQSAGLRLAEGGIEPLCLLLLGGMVAVEERIELFDHVLEDALHLRQTIVENQQFYFQGHIPAEFRLNLEQNAVLLLQRVEVREESHHVQLEVFTVIQDLASQCGTNDRSVLLSDLEDLAEREFEGISLGHAQDAFDSDAGQVGGSLEVFYQCANGLVIYLGLDLPVDRQSEGQFVGHEFHLLAELALADVAPSTEGGVGVPAGLQGMALGLVHVNVHSDFALVDQFEQVRVAGQTEVVVDVEGRALWGLRRSRIAVALVVAAELDEELPHVVEASVLRLIEGGLDVVQVAKGVQVDDVLAGEQTQGAEEGVLLVLVQVVDLPQRRRGQFLEGRLIEAAAEVCELRVFDFDLDLLDVGDEVEGGPEVGDELGEEAVGVEGHCEEVGHGGCDYSI